MHPIDRIKSDHSLAVRIDYPNDRVETMWTDEQGVLVGMMDGMGPWPLDEHDARVVCDTYDAEVVDRETVEVGGAP